MTLTYEEARTAMIDRLVDELDPRNHVATKAFFALLRPDVAEKIAHHYNKFNRVQIEIALRLKAVEIELIEKPGVHRDTDFRKQAAELLATLYPGNFEGWNEVEEFLVALRGDLDGSIIEQLDNITLEMSQGLLGDGWEEQIDKQIQLANV